VQGVGPGDRSPVAARHRCRGQPAAAETQARPLRPTFPREIKDKDLWSRPVSARFHFKLAGGPLTEVSAAHR
jgi:hypothetical protein